MDALIARFANTGGFSEEKFGELERSNDRIRYHVHATRVLARTRLANSTTEIQSVPLGETWVATALRIVNTDTVVRTVTLRDVPYGKANGAEWDWISRLEINANETVYLYGIEDVWEGGYTIYAHADAANVVNLKIMGTPLLDS